MFSPVEDETREERRHLEELGAFPARQREVDRLEVTGPVVAGHALRLDAQELGRDVVRERVLRVLDGIALLEAAHDEVHRADAVRGSRGGDGLRGEIAEGAVVLHEVA